MKTVSHIFRRSGILSAVLFIAMACGCGTFCYASSAPLPAEKSKQHNFPFYSDLNTLRDTIEDPNRIHKKRGWYTHPRNNHLFRDNEIVRKVRMKGGTVVTPFNPEIDDFTFEPRFSCALSRDIINPPSWINLTTMVNDSNTTTSFRVFLHPGSLKDYDLLELLSPGDVIGCDMAYIEEIPDYQKLMEKGIRFIDFRFIGKVVTFFAGDGDWVKVTLDGIEFRVILDIKPNDTGKERSIGISLDGPYGRDGHFCANGFQIIQLAK